MTVASPQISPSDYPRIAKQYALKLGFPVSHSAFDDIVSDAIWRMTNLAMQDPEAERRMFYRAAKLGAIDGLRKALGKTDTKPDGEVVKRKPVHLQISDAKTDFLFWSPPEGRQDAVATMKALLKVYPPTSIDGGAKVSSILLDIAGGMTRQAAGDVAGVSPGRVSQIVASYVQRVRRANPTISRENYAHGSMEHLMMETWS